MDLKIVGNIRDNPSRQLNTINNKGSVVFRDLALLTVEQTVSC